MTQTKEWRRPYRIVVFCHGLLQTTGRRKPKVSGYAYDGWTPVQHYREARLPNAGSFLFPGIVAVRKAAMEYLAAPETHQVQIRTIQNRKVYLWNKAGDARISGYAPDNDGY